MRAKADQYDCCDAAGTQVAGALTPRTGGSMMRHSHKSVTAYPGNCIRETNVCVNLAVLAGGEATVRLGARQIKTLRLKSGA